MDYTDLFVEKYRPTTLDEMVLESSVYSRMKNILSGDSPIIPNILLYGKPGTGKTTLARIIANTLDWETIVINGSGENGIDVIRDKVSTFCSTASVIGGRKLVIFEEADGLSSSSGNGSSAQQMLKALIEDSSDTVRFVMTVNDITKMDAAIKSRMECIYVCPPTGNKCHEQVIKRLFDICKAEGITFDWDKEKDGVANHPLRLIAKDCFPDIRKSVDFIQRHSFNKDKILSYRGGEFKSISEMADYICNYLINNFYKAAAKTSSLVSLREYVIKSEDNINGSFHSLMGEMIKVFIRIDPNSIGDSKQLGVVLEIQDRMKWYNLVMDKELHFFAMLISIAKILSEKD